MHEEQERGQIKVAGSTVYVLNDDRVPSNLWWANVQPGRDDEGRQLTYEACEAIAQQIAASLAKPQPVGGALTARALRNDILSYYKEHYDFPAQGESHMRDVIDDVLESALAALSAPVAQPGAKAEREACARLCDEFGDAYMVQARNGDSSGASDHKACAAAEIADAIRARAPAASEAPTDPIERLREVTAGRRVPLYKPHDANEEDDTYDHE
jgi:hypothetical protein